MALHEHERTVRRLLLLATLRDVPSFLILVGDVAVVSRHSLELDLSVTLHRSSDCEAVLLEHLEKDLLLDVVLVFI